MLPLSLVIVLKRMRLPCEIKAIDFYHLRYFALKTCSSILECFSPVHYKALQVTKLVIDQNQLQNNEMKMES